MYKILLTLQNRQRRFAKGEYKKVKDFRLVLSKSPFRNDIYCYIDSAQNRFRFFGFYSKFDKKQLDDMILKLDKYLNDQQN